jgi:PTS system nitrogen regulatory IIA component
MTKKLDASQAARCLGVSTGTIERWVRQGKIPARRQGAEWAFDTLELREWARTNSLPFRESSELAQTALRTEAVTVAQALERGGFHFDVDAATVDEVLEALAFRAPIAPDCRAELSQRLREREELSSTGIGGGVAVPHPREPMAEVVRAASVTTCFLRSPIDFGAVDGKPVRVAFLLLSPDVKTHLRLLSRLAFCLGDEEFSSLVVQPPRSIEELLAGVERVERRIAS